MTFTQVDDAWPDSPEVLAVSRSARLLEVEGKCYANRHLTNGRITRAQWLRATDTETFEADLTELVEAGLVGSAGPSVYQLDWQHQQTREQVESGRARRRADNERRAKALELHRAGDHTLCTHEGGGRARQTLTASNGPSTEASTGPTKGRKGGRSNGASSGLSVVGSPSPTQPSPTQPVVKRRGGGAGRGTDGSATATPSVPAPGEGAPGAQRGGVAPPTEEEAAMGLAGARLERYRAALASHEEALAEDADSLAGLIPAGGAGAS